MDSVDLSENINIAEVCRACFETCKHYKFLCDKAETIENQTLGDVFFDVVKMEVKTEDESPPTRICLSCSYDLENAYKFIQKSQKNNERLIQLLMHSNTKQADCLAESEIAIPNDQNISDTFQIKIEKEILQDNNDSSLMEYNNSSINSFGSDGSDNESLSNKQVKIPKLECRHCNRIFKKQNLYEDHLRSHIEEDVKKEEIEETEDGCKFECYECNFSCHSDLELEKHQQSEHTTRYNIFRKVKMHSRGRQLVELAKSHILKANDRKMSQENLTFDLSDIPLPSNEPEYNQNAWSTCIDQSHQTRLYEPEYIQNASSTCIDQSKCLQSRPRSSSSSPSSSFSSESSGSSFESMPASAIHFSSKNNDSNNTPPNPSSSYVPIMVSPPKKGIQRRKNTQSWKRNIVKRNRNLGLEYESLSKKKKIIAKRELKAVCGEKCNLKCSSKFSQDERQGIFANYWALGDIERQRLFINNCMAVIAPKYRYTREGGTRAPRCKNNAFYFCKSETEKVRVCKVFFKNTLDISDRTIRTVREKRNKIVDVLLEPDLRGKHGKHKTLDPAIRNGIRNHINSIPKIESQYTRANSTRTFVDGSRSLADIHRDYVSECKAKNEGFGSYAIFYKLFTEAFNISDCKGS